MVFTINIWAVLVSGLVYMVIGSLWYSPMGFGKKWLHYMGWTEKDMESKKKGMGKAYAVMFIGALVTSYILAHFVQYTGAHTWLEGMQTGFWLWLGFIAATGVGSIMFEGRPTGLYLINVGYNLVMLLITGALIAVWQ